MPNSRAIEDVEAALAKETELFDAAGDRIEDFDYVAQVALHAAEPPIRKAEQERIREALDRIYDSLEAVNGDQYHGGEEERQRLMAEALADTRAEVRALLDSEQVEGAAGQVTLTLSREQAAGLLTNCEHARSWTAINKVCGEAAFLAALDTLRAALHEGGEARG